MWMVVIVICLFICLLIGRSRRMPFAVRLISLLCLIIGLLFSMGYFFIGLSMFLLVRVVTEAISESGGLAWLLGFNVGPFMISLGFVFSAGFIWAIRSQIKSQFAPETAAGILAKGRVAFDTLVFIGVDALILLLFCWCTMVGKEPSAGVRQKQQQEDKRMDDEISNRNF